MKIIVVIEQFQNDKISQIYFPAINSYHSLPNIDLNNLRTYLNDNIYKDIYTNSDLIKKIIAFNSSDYQTEDKLFVVEDIAIEDHLGFLTRSMPWVGRGLLVLTFIIASINSFLSVVSQGDEDNSNTAFAIIGIIINLMMMPMLYKYSRASSTYRGLGFFVEDGCCQVKSTLCNSTNNSTTKNYRTISSQRGQENTDSCSTSHITSRAMFGLVYIIGLVSLIIQYKEYSNGIKSLNDNACRNNAPCFPDAIMPYLSVVAGSIVGTHKTVVESSFLYRGAEYIRDRFLLSENKNDESSLTPELDSQEELDVQEQETNYGDLEYRPF